MNKKTCIITGIGGQDACIMASILLGKGWTVYGLTRPTTNKNFWRLDEEGILYHPKLNIVECDITDCTGIFNIVGKVQPEWFINLAAISAVGTSFDSPMQTANTDAMGPLYCLEAIRQLSPETRFYQASTSEMVANSKNHDGLGNEDTKMIPRSPYAAAKLFAHNMVGIYRDAYNIFACSSILYNHSSKYRGEYFVERKICKYVAELYLGINEPYLYLGNLKASRDIGHAADYMRGVYYMLEHNIPDDYTLATGNTYTIEQILDIAFDHIGKNWEDYVKIDPKFYRPCEVHHLVGDYSKARDILKWEPIYNIQMIIEELVKADIDRIEKKSPTLSQQIKIMDREFEKYKKENALIINKIGVHKGCI